MSSVSGAIWILFELWYFEWDKCDEKNCCFSPTPLGIGDIQIMPENELGCVEHYRFYHFYVMGDLSHGVGANSIFFFLILCFFCVFCVVSMFQNVSKQN